MFSRLGKAAAVASVAAMVMSVAVGAASTYNITVTLDETTRGDMDMVKTSVRSADLGTEVPRSVRRLASGAAGELALLASQRIDTLGNLRLDDGAIVPLSDGDRVLVSAAGDTQVDYLALDGSATRAAQSRVLLIREPCSSDKCSMKPSAVLIATGNGGCRLVLLFAHPPVISTCS
jgi:hypothetical protein